MKIIQGRTAARNETEAAQIIMDRYDAQKPPKIKYTMPLAGGLTWYEFSVVVEEDSL